MEVYLQASICHCLFLMNRVSSTITFWICFMSASLLRILKKYHTQTYGYKNRNKTKQKDLGEVVLGFFSYEIHKFVNLSFCIFKRWSFSALKFRERISKLLTLCTFISKSVHAHSNQGTGAVWHVLVNNRGAQFRQESSRAMFMNFNVFLQ